MTREKTEQSWSSPPTSSTLISLCRSGVALGLILSLALVVWTSTASAKQVVDYFGADPAIVQGSLGGEFSYPKGVAVNQSGAGVGEAGDIYVAEQTPGSGNGNQNRIQRFHRNNNGTPTDPYDDTFEFVSAWGADVVQAGGVGDKGDAADGNYEICTVASQCKAGVASGGNATAAGNGGLDNPRGIAVDQDTGNVYVYDAGNFRGNVYAGDGTFLRSFGWDVVDSGPSEQPAPNEVQELRISAEAGKFSLEFRGETTGGRAGPANDALMTSEGSKTIKNFAIISGAFEPGQAFSTNRLPREFPLGTTVTAFEPGILTVSQLSSTGGCCRQLYGDDLGFNISAAELEAELNALPSIGSVGGSVTVTGGPGNSTGSTPYMIEFGGTLAGDDVPQLVVNDRNLMLGSGEGDGSLSTPVTGGAYEVCDASAGDVCGTGTAGEGVGQLGMLGDAGGGGIALSAPDENLSNGLAFVTDPANNRVARYNLDGSTPGSIGSVAVFDEGSSTVGDPGSLAVDSRGILYAGTSKSDSDIERYDSEGVNGGGVGFLDPIESPTLSGQHTGALTVDPDGDGNGPDTDVLYVMSQGTGIRQFGPVNAPGQSTSPGEEDALHGAGQFTFASGIALDEAGGQIYGASIEGAGQFAHGIYVLHDAGDAPTAQIDSVTDITPSSATVNATVNPNGGPLVSYRLEYSADGANWTPLATQPLGAQTTPQAVQASLDPPGAGLAPETEYQVRLVVTKRFAAPVITAPESFTTLAAPPQAETVGSPIRTATTAQLAGRVNPNGAPTEFHFEYVAEAAFNASGFADLSSGGETEPVSAGAGTEISLVAARVEGLEPATAYRYRVVADNGNPGSPVFGEPVGISTRASDGPLSHGELPGPPGSDRAYEQVNVAETGGNPVIMSFAAGFSEDGERAIYGVGGGTPLTDTGTAFSQLYAERTPSGWETRTIHPLRDALIGPHWTAPVGAADFSTFYAYNAGFDGGAFFRVSPKAPPAKLYDIPANANANFYAAPDDGSRLVVALLGARDPAYPQTANTNLYEITSGSPQLISLLPGGVVAPCGVTGLGSGAAPDAQNWLSEEGRYLFFASRGGNCAAVEQLYVRDLVAGASKLLSGPPLSGPACGAGFIKSTPGAVFFRSATRLVAEDEALPCAEGGDVYRYELASEELECVTCVVAGLATKASVAAVAPDGSRVYFRSASRLLAGAAPDGTYRVMVGSGELAYLGALGAGVGENVAFGQAINADGSALLFRSAAPTLNPLGEGHDNGGTAQYYRYDDKDGSLVCVSCPPDGSAPREAVRDRLNINGVEQSAPGLTYLSDAGDLAFSTTEALVFADQNSPPADRPQSPGIDVYEWRDGRLLLVTDGLRRWIAGQGPEVAAISRSGRDIFFIASAPLTPDALDDYYRLYDARIGGGFHFPTAPPPCALEVCQGTPKGAPEERAPGTGAFLGPGNVAPKPRTARCAKGKRRVQRGGKARCVKRKGAKGKRRDRANHVRRVAR
jgi:hypothetical protein